MELKGICIHTTDVPRLADFYSEVLGLTAEGNHIHAVFNEVNLAIWNPGAIDENRFNISERFLTLMFEVDNVDNEYERLNRSDIPITFTSQPTEHPWGAKAFGFKDPDGNNIDFLSPVK